MAAVVGVVARRMSLDWRHHHHSEREMKESEKKQNKNAKRQKKQMFSVSRDVEFELYKKYAPRDVLGKGTFGVVCSAINLETNETVAIKKIADPFRSPITARRTLRETQILRRMGPHDNIVELKDVMLSDNIKDEAVYLVHELMDYDLAHIIASKHLPDGIVKYLIFQILRGLKFLHSANVIHRDLKPANVLVNSNWSLKICDFGLARTAPPGLHKMNSNIGTPRYMAPELLDKAEAWYDNRVDVWSAGCILAELLGGAPGDAWFPSADLLALSLLKKRLVADPSRRISASQALEHPYFVGLYDPILDISAPAVVSLEVDRNPEGLPDKKIRDLLWTETLFYHPEEHMHAQPSFSAHPFLQIARQISCSVDVVVLYI